MKNVQLGSSFDDFLEREGLRSGMDAVAIKRAIAYQIESEMKESENDEVGINRTNGNRSIRLRQVD